MRLTELAPRWVRIVHLRDRRKWPAGELTLEEAASCASPDLAYEITEAPSMMSADGLELLCPRCFLNHGGPIGTESLHLWGDGVPATVSPQPGRWHRAGTGFGDLTLTGAGGTDSIDVKGGCAAHFYIRGGEIVFV